MVVVESLRITALSFTKASLEMNLVWRNPNAFPLSFDGYEVGLKLNDIPVMKGSFETGGMVKEGDDLSLTLPFSIDFLDAGRSVYDLLTKGTITYAIDGRMEITGTGGSYVPVGRKGTITIKR